MKIQLTEKFFNKVRDHYKDSRADLFITYDGKAWVDYKYCTDENGYSVNVLIFHQTGQDDTGSIVQTTLNDNWYFDTETFGIIDEGLKIVDREIDIDCECNVNVNNNKIERDIPKELVLELATALENDYLGIVSKRSELMSPEIRNLLNRIIQFKRDEQYKVSNIFDRLCYILEDYHKNKEYLEKDHNSTTDEQVRDLMKATFKQILQELVNFGIVTTVIQEGYVLDPDVSLEERVIEAMVEKLKL